MAEKKMNKNIFREYDIRGIAEKDLTNEIVENIGKAYGTYIKNMGKNEIIIGRDTRLSSDRIFSAIKKGIKSTGCNVWNIGIVATPIFYYSLVKHKKDGGIMITASHNPPEYNGFKVCVNSDVIYGNELHKIYEIAKKEAFISGNGKEYKLDVANDYIEEITSGMNIDKNLKVIIDCGNGTAGLFARKIFEKVNMRPFIIFEKPDGRFPNHEADPTVASNLSMLIEKVKNEQADIGIAFDGDVDRIGIVDEKGRIIFGDKLLGIYAKPIIKKKPGAEVIFEVKCSQGLIDYLNKIGAKSLMWKVGHSLIKAKMKEDKALLAGEMSGHMFFKDRYYGFDDAFYSALRILEILSESKKTLSELADEIPYYESTPEIRVKCSEDKKFKIVESLKEEFSKDYKIIDIDGIRINFENGWALIRASNTQPVLVLRFEAKNKTYLDHYINLIKNQLRKYDLTF